MLFYIVLVDLYILFNNSTMYLDLLEELQTILLASRLVGLGTYRLTRKILLLVRGHIVDKSLCDLRCSGCRLSSKKAIISTQDSITGD